VNCKHINVRNALFKHVTKTVNYIIFDGVILLNRFSPFFYEQDLLGRGSKITKSLVRKPDSDISMPFDSTKTKIWI